MILLRSHRKYLRKALATYEFSMKQPHLDTGDLEARTRWKLATTLRAIDRNEDADEIQDLEAKSTKHIAEVLEVSPPMYANELEAIYDLLSLLMESMEVYKANGDRDMNTLCLLFTVSCTACERIRA